MLKNVVLGMAVSRSGNSALVAAILSRTGLGYWPRGGIAFHKQQKWYTAVNNF